jgi:hypothetical protein
MGQQRRRSKRDADGQHFVLEFLCATGWKLAAQQGAYLARLGVEHFAEHLCVVAVPGKSRLHVVDIFGQDAFDDLDGDRLLSDPVGVT